MWRRSYGLRQLKCFLFLFAIQMPLRLLGLIVTCLIARTMSYFEFDSIDGLMWFFKRQTRLNSIWNFCSKECQGNDQSAMNTWQLLPSPEAGSGLGWEICPSNWLDWRRCPGALLFPEQWYEEACQQVPIGCTYCLNDKVLSSLTFICIDARRRFSSTPAWARPPVVGSLDCLFLLGMSGGTLSPTICGM